MLSDGSSRKANFSSGFCPVFLFSKETIINTRFTSVGYIPIFTEVIQFDSYNKIAAFCKKTVPTKLK